MRQTLTRWLFTGALTCACITSPAFAADEKATTDLDKRLIDARAVYQELLGTPDRGIPEALRNQATCICVIPHEIKGAVGYGARFGRGVMSCKTANGWSAPSFVTLEGVSAGLQLGAESTDLVLFFMSERGARSLLTSSKITLGGKLSVAAGPLGRSGEASTDLKLNAEIYSYARSKGLFAGASVEGSHLAADNNSNHKYYDQTVSVKGLLFDNQVKTPPESARTFTNALP